jgi:hypothetical protein
MGSIRYDKKKLDTEARWAVKGKGRLVRWELVFYVDNTSRLSLHAFYVDKDGQEGWTNVALA